MATDMGLSHEIWSGNAELETIRKDIWALVLDYLCNGAWSDRCDAHNAWQWQVNSVTFVGDGDFDTQVEMDWDALPW